jgi:serine/threonine protein kinase
MTAPAYDIPGYDFVRELGSGGMATVYLAVQRSLDRKIAIKIMRRGLADANTEQRFLNEGRMMARLPRIRHCPERHHQLHRDGVSRRRPAV